METNHLSTSSIGDEKFNEGASGMKSESGERNIPRIQIYDETGRSVEVSQGSSITVQNESWEAKKNRSSVCTIGKDSTSNILFTVGDENLKASKSMLSLSATSTTAICGSSSSDIASSEEKPFGDLENVSEKRGTDSIDSAQSNNQLDQQYEETDNRGVTLGSRSKVRNENLKVQEGLSSDCTVVKDSESNISLRVDNENLKTSESMLSFISTAATYGSSSSDITSSEDEPLGDLEDISKKHETQHAYNLENPILEPTPRAANEISNYPSTYSGTNLSDESQTDFEFTSAKESLLTEDSSSLQSQDINNSLDEDTLQLLPTERHSKQKKAEEFPLKMSLSSTLNCFSDMEDPSSNNNPITVPPLVPMVSSLNTRRVETLEISNCGPTLGVVICHGKREAYWKKNKSVRRTGVQTLSEIASEFLAPSIPNSSRKVESSFLQVLKPLQQTSPEEGDWDLYKNSGRGADEKCSVQKPWVEELISSWQEIADSDANRGLEIESLAEDVHHFFENNHMDADVNMSSEESKHQVASKDFSDEFPRRHGLLSHEKLIKECLNNLERYTSPNLKTQLELQEMCKMLVKFSIPEEAFIKFVGRKILMMSGRECDVDSFSETSNRELQDYFNELRFSITEDFDFFVMVKLYKKLKYEGTTFLSILNESKNSSPDSYDQSIVDIDCRITETLAQNETGDTGCLSSSEGDVLQIQKSAADTGCPSSSEGDVLQIQKSAADTGCPSSSEGDVLQKDESATESPKIHSRESEETSNIVIIPDSNVLDSSVSAENELRSENTSLSGSEMTKELQASYDLGTGKVGSKVSAEDSDFTKDRTDDNSEE